MATKTTKTAPETTTAARAILAGIAAEAGIETLETRRSDSLDFHDLAVWTLREMLEKAYEAGRAAR